MEKAGLYNQEDIVEKVHKCDFKVRSQKTLQLLFLSLSHSWTLCGGSSGYIANSLRGLHAEGLKPPATP